MVDNVMQKWKTNAADKPEPDFRAFELHTDHVELLYTMNEEGIKAVFELICNNIEGHVSDSLPPRKHYMDPIDAHWFFKKKLRLGLNKQQIFGCFALSKMTIVQDHNKEENAKYRKLLYVEFLELIARIAV
jgi:hypothetical protein